MIEGLKPYSRYMESGVPWLGQIPIQWRIERMKTVLRERIEKDHAEEPLLAATQTMGVVRKDRYENRTVLALKDLHLLKLVNVGDFVISLRSFQGGIEFARDRGIISPAYTVLHLVDQRNHGFLSWLFKSKPFIESLSLSVTGIRQGQSVDYPSLSRSRILLPPLDEQYSIVRFLNYADRRIRRYIAAQRKLIALLEEQKQAIIHRSVTRGLDPNVRMKDSGVPWIGEVPEHWDALQLKRLARSTGHTFTDGDWIETPYITREGVRLIQTGNVGIGEYREKGFRYISDATFAELRCTEVCPGDVLICRLDGPVGRACLAPNLGCKMITSVDNTILKPRSDVSGQYVVHLLSSPLWIDWVKSLCRAGGGFRYRVSRTMLGLLSVPLPPFSEQLAINEFIATTTGSVYKMILALRAESNRLLEFRTRLISDVVTGKLDVRDAAAKLPIEDDSTPDAELIDDGDSDDGDDVVANEDPA